MAVRCLKVCESSIIIQSIAIWKKKKNMAFGPVGLYEEFVEKGNLRVQFFPLF